MGGTPLAYQWGKSQKNLDRADYVIIYARYHDVDWLSAGTVYLQVPIY